MTINEIHQKYFHTKSITKHRDADGFKLWINCALRTIPIMPEADTFSSIFITWDEGYLMHQDKFFDDIVESLKVLNCGNRLFFDDIPEWLISYMFEKFKNEVTDFGISIIHIENVGYIIARPTEGSLKMYNTYSLDEYLKKMDEYVVCGIAKNEDNYIEDWVKFHLRIGFDHIYLYDNNAPDKAKYAGMLKQYIDAGKVTVIDVRHLSGQQVAAYMSAYYGFPFKYMAIIDIDEFVWLNERGKYSNIKDFIEDVEKDSQPNAGITIQWKCYQGSDEPVDPKIPIWEANPTPIDPRFRKGNRPELINGWPKTIYKNGYNIKSHEHFGWEFNDRLHEFSMQLINCYGDRYVNKCFRFKTSDPGDDPVCIRHYLIRDVENVYYNKYLRGHAGVEDKDKIIGADGWDWWQWFHNMNYMTDVTPVISKHDQLFLRSKGMKINYTFHPDTIIINNKLNGNLTINSVINGLLTDVMNYCSSIYIENTVRAVDDFKQPDYRDQFNVSKDDYDFDFLCHFISTNSFCGHIMDQEPWLVGNGIQDPIVINIGFPLDCMYNEYDDKKTLEYIEWIRRFLNPANLRFMLRLIIEHPTYFIFPAFSITRSETCAGWKDVLNEWLPSIGLTIPECGLSNNTFITSMSNYLKLKDYQQKFVDKFGSFSDKNIVDNIKGGYTTPYHAYIYSYPALFKDLFFLSI